MTEEESQIDGAALGRRLVRSCERAALATSLLGAPYASLVLVAADLDASPLLLLSDLAQHSRNLAFDPRLSLLYDGAAGHADRLDGPRLSVLGRAEPVADERLLARFIARHPSSARYAGFADFRIYRVVVERGHLVAGFGRIEWVEGKALVSSGAFTALAEAEAAITTQLSRDHAAILDRCAQTVLGLVGSGWRMTGLDPEGADLRRGGAIARLDFAVPEPTTAAVLAMLEQLATGSEQSPRNACRL